MMKIVSRAEWGAKPPKAFVPMAMPAPEVWLHHTAGADRPDTKDVAIIQQQHLAKGWYDIAYSFLIDGNGIVYEGRGPGVVGSHTKGHNSKSHAICLIGNFEVADPTTAALDSLVALLRHGAEKRWWPKPMLTGGHRDVDSTLCPGENLYRRIESINTRAQGHVHCSCIAKILKTITAGE